MVHFRRQDTVPRCSSHLEEGPHVGLVIDHEQSENSRFLPGRTMPVAVDDWVEPNDGEVNA